MADPNRPLLCFAPFLPIRVVASLPRVPVSSLLKQSRHASDWALLQASRLTAIVEAKESYERSLAAVKELLDSGIITQAEADREILLAQDTLNKIKSGNIDKVRRGGCLPIMALLAKKRAAEAPDNGDLFGMEEAPELEDAPLTRAQAQRLLDEAMAGNDAEKVQAAIDKLKEFEQAEKAHKASLHSMGHWGGHTLGRTLKESELEDAIQKGDGEKVQKLVEELKQMDDASQEDSVSISG